MARSVTLPIAILLNRYLRRIGVRIDGLTLQNRLDEHPMPGSLRSVNDVLTDLGLDCTTVRLTAEELAEIPSPYLVTLRTEEDSLSVVERYDNREVTLRSGHGKKTQLHTATFLALWEGIVFGAETDGTVRPAPQRQYRLRQALFFLERNLYTFFLFGAVLLLCIGSAAFIHSAQLALLAALKAQGMLVAGAILYKTYFAPTTLSSICQAGKRVDCNAVLHSKAATVGGWVSLSELAFAYFFSTLLGCMLPDPGTVLAIASAAAAGFMLFSIVWQLSKKTMCSLCMAVDLIIAGELAVTFLWPQALTPVGLLPHFLLLALLFTTILSGTMICRKLFGSVRKEEALQRKNDRLLAATALFDTLLTASYPMPDASGYEPMRSPVHGGHILTVIMNPSCPKCGKLHYELMRMENMAVQLILAVQPGDDRSRQAALQFLSLYRTRGWEAVSIALDRWYETGRLPAVPVIEEARGMLQLHSNYCSRIRLHGTPEVGIGGRRLPDFYDVTELRVLVG